MEKETVHHSEEHMGTKHTSVLRGTEALEEAKLKEPPNPWSSRNIKLYLSCLVCFLCSTANGYDGSLFNSILLTQSFKDTFGIEDEGIWTGIVANMYTLGSVAALPLIGPVLDQGGRRFGMFGGSALIILGTIIQGLTVHNGNQGQFMGGRFLLGFGVAFMSTAGPILVLEMAHPAYRGKLAAFYNTFWFTGSILASGATRATYLYKDNRAWLVVTWLQCLFAGVVLIFTWLLPESPRWTYTRGKMEQTKKMLTYWHGNDNPDSVWVTLQLREYEEHLEMDGADKRWWDYRALFRDRASVYRLSCNLIVVVFGQWTGNAVMSYYRGAVLKKSGYTSELQVKNINLIMDCVQFACALVGARTVDFFGRRPLLLFANAGCALAWVGVTASTASFEKSASSAAGTASLAFMYIFGMIFSFGFTPLQALLPVEVLSFEMRGKGMAFSQFIMNLAMLLNNFAWPEALKKIGWRTYIIFAIWDVIQTIVIYFVIPETKGRTLEELDDIFEAASPVKASLAKRQVAVTSDNQVLEVEKEV